jgi:hypothetical protein
MKKKRNRARKMRAMAKRLKGQSFHYVNPKGEDYMVTVHGIKGNHVVMRAYKEKGIELQTVGFPSLFEGLPGLGSGLAAPGAGGGGLLGGFGSFNLLLPMLKFFRLFSSGAFKGLG